MARIDNVPRSNPRRPWARGAGFMWLLFVVGPAALVAQTSPTPGMGSIAGTVTDESGAVVSGVTLTLTDAARGVQQRTTTDAQGDYLFASVAPGRYTIAGGRVGFSPVRVDGVVVMAGGRHALPFQLKVAALVEGVAVVAAERVPTRSASATKTDTPLIETPQAITVITRDQIEAQAAQNMQEVVRYTAGVRAEMYGPDNRGDWFTMRGGSEGSTVLDGLRLPLSGWWGNVRNEPYAFDRVEVVRGPASVMFGQNGPGGLVSLVSKLPQAQTRREITVQLGNYAHKQVGADFTGPLSADGSLLYRVVFLAKDAGTQVDYADEARQFVAPSITWRPNATTLLTLYGQYQRDESENNVGFFPWVGTLLPAPNGQIPDDTFIGEPAWDSYGGHRARVGYQVTRQLNQHWSLRHNLRYDDVDGHVLGMYANFFEGGFLEDGRSLNRTWYASRTDTRIATTDVQAEGRLTLGATRHTVFVGVDGVWSRNVIADIDGPATPLDVYRPVYGTFPLPELDYGEGTPTRATQIGVTVQDQIKVADRWVFVAGVRHDFAKNEVTDAPEAGSDDTAWSRRLGLVYLFDGGWAPYASYSDSFEAVPGADVYGTAYKPKRGEQVEGGVKWSPADGRVAFTASAYELEETNRLTTDPDNPINQLQRGEVTVQGFDVEAVANLRAWDLVANYTYADAKVTASSDPDDPYLGKRLHSIPEHSAALWAVRRFGLQRGPAFSAGLGVRFVGETWDGTDALATPSTTLVDALFSIDRGPLRFAVNASNLLDKTYIATCLDRGDCWYGNRRKVVASVTYRR